MISALAALLALAPALPPPELVVVDDAPVAEQAAGVVLDGLVSELRARGFEATRASLLAPGRVANHRVEARIVVDVREGLVLLVTRRTRAPAVPEQREQRVALSAMQGISGLPTVVAALWAPTPANTTTTASAPQGELAADAIRRVVNAHIGEIQLCYQRQLKTTPDLKGRVVVEWQVTSSGAVAAAKATSSTLPPPAADCMVQKVSAWKFPAPTGGPVTISFPFVFNAAP